MTSQSDLFNGEKLASLGEAIVNMMVGIVGANEYLNRAEPEPPREATSGKFTAVNHYGYLAVFDGDECVMKLSYEDADQLIGELSLELTKQRHRDGEIDITEQW